LNSKLTEISAENIIKLVEDHAKGKWTDEQKKIFDEIDSRAP